MSADGKKVFFTWLELHRLQAALSMDDSVDEEYRAAMDSAEYKIGLALEQPWAIEKKKNENI